MEYDTIPERNMSRDENNNGGLQKYAQNLIEITMKRRGGKIVIYMHSPDTPSKCEPSITR